MATAERGWRRDARENTNRLWRVTLDEVLTQQNTTFVPLITCWIDEHWAWEGRRESKPEIFHLPWPLRSPPPIYPLLLSEALAGPGAHVAASFGQKAFQTSVLCKYWDLVSNGPTKNTVTCVILKGNNDLLRGKPRLERAINWFY